MRMIVAFDSLGAKTVMTLFKAPVSVNGINEGRSIRITPLQGIDAQQRGKELAKMLQRHAPVKQAMGFALAQPPATPPAPIYFRVASASADSLPWEQLFFTGQGFLALDERWPIGRIAKRVHDVRQRSFEAPFRVVAVLSAAGESGNGLPQLKTLIRTVGEARAQGLDAALHIISGDEQVIDAVTALADPTVTVDWIASTPTDIARQIGDARPAILHLLCHGGYAAPGIPGLNFATDTDFSAEAGMGSNVVSIDALAGALDGSTWLVVLAACRTAAADDVAATEGASPVSSSGAQSAAHSLADRGVPAVIGMREIVDLSAMDRFCTSVYPELLSIVTRALAEDGTTERIVEWAPALTAPRLASVTGDPVNDVTWSDPVLYVQQEELRVDSGPARGVDSEDLDALRGRLDEFLNFMQVLDPRTTPRALLKDVQVETSRLLREVAKATR